jgi:hypothetical protein
MRMRGERPAPLVQPGTRRGRRPPSPTGPLEGATEVHRDPDELVHIRRAGRGRVDQDESLRRRRRAGGGGGRYSGGRGRGGCCRGGAPRPHRCHSGRALRSIQGASWRRARPVRRRILSEGTAHPRRARHVVPGFCELWGRTTQHPTNHGCPSAPRACGGCRLCGPVTPRRWARRHRVPARVCVAPPPRHRGPTEAPTHPRRRFAPDTDPRFPDARPPQSCASA